MEITFEVNEKEQQAIESIADEFSMTVEDYCRQATIPPIEDEAVSRFAKHASLVGRLFDEYCKSLNELKKETKNIGIGYGL